MTGPICSDRERVLSAKRFGISWCQLEHYYVEHRRRGETDFPGEWALSTATVSKDSWNIH